MERAIMAEHEQQESHEQESGDGTGGIVLDKPKNKDLITKIEEKAISKAIEAGMHKVATQLVRSRSKLNTSTQNEIQSLGGGGMAGVTNPNPDRKSTV